MGGWVWTVTKLVLTTFLRALAFQDSVDTVLSLHVCLRPGCTVDKGGDNVRIMPDHTELAPGGAYGPVLDHNALVRFGLS